MGGTWRDLVLTDPGYLSAPSTSVLYYATHRVQPALVLVVVFYIDHILLS
jgi:hypothetical protein